ncbi:PAS domain S-box protein [Myxococcota bacterium]|nr:PAS domain S-box protein [Myxococcota bacterium]
MKTRKHGRPKRGGVWLRLDATLACVDGGGKGLERLLGAPIGLLLGKPLLDAVRFVDGDAIAEVLRGVIEGSAGAVVVAERAGVGAAGWLEIAVRPSSDPARAMAGEDEAELSPLIELGFEDVTARVGEEMRLRTALAEERAQAELASELARWSDSGLEEALAAGLERIARQFGAESVRVVDDRDPIADDGRARIRCAIPALTPPRSLELEWPAGRRSRAEPGRLLGRHAELVGAVLARLGRDGDLRAGEARFQALADHSRDGICEVGEDGRVLYASPSHATLCGVEPRELVGARFLASIEPDDHRRVAHLIRPGAHARRRGALVYRLRQPDGSLRSVESTAREFAGPDDRPRVVVTTRDVTEREQARLALERQIELEARVAELSRYFIDLDVDATDAGIESKLAVVAGLAEAQHIWLYSFATGLGEPEAFDWWFDPTVARRPGPPEQAVARFPYSTGLIMAGRIYHVPRVDALPPEAQNERRDLELRGVRAMLGIPIMSGGRFVGFLGFENFEREIAWSEETIMLLRLVGEIFYSCLRRRRAVEDLRDSQSQLLQAQKMEAVGTLAGGIAHDFNNHLAVMLGNARFLRQEVDGEGDVLAAIEDLERSADHCAKLTRSLLAFSRRSPVEVVPVAVAELVRGVEGLVKPLLPPSFRLETELGSALGEFAVDQVQIQQVLVNLLVNARDAMAEGGLIRMAAERRRLVASEAGLEGLDARREYVVLSVADTGCGMDPGTLRRVFEPFFTTKPIGQGTGLGLAMAYGIVRQSGGAIAIESRVGEGSTVRVYLPALALEASEAPRSARASEAKPGAGRAAVFEPDPAGRALVCEVLAEQGYEVEIASSPEWVAEQVRRASVSIDLVVAAMPRPSPTPDDFAEVLRGGVTGPPVLALAEVGHVPVDASDRRVRVLRKPLARAELRSTLEVWLEVVREG